MSLIAFGLAGVSLVGLPPSGGFAAKWLLLSAAVSTGQWWWATVLVLGGLLTGGYVMLVLVRAMGSTRGAGGARQAGGPFPRGGRAGDVALRRAARPAGARARRAAGLR